MISISLASVTLILGARRIFENLTWEIQHDQKIGLIGPNGAGKSSLFKIITGEYAAEPGGSVTRARGVTVGYLAQQPEFDSQQSALALALAGNPRVAQVRAELEAVEASMAQPEVYNHSERLARAVERQQLLVEEYQSLGGDQYEDRVQEMLKGLGLSQDDFEKPGGLLSGGQKKLIGIARLVLLQPDVLLLDEPDNHLDLPGKAYLERLIQAYAGAVVLISHDRYLLDAVATHIVEIEDGRLTTFSGDYSGYIVDKEIRLARQEELFRVQQHEVSRLEAAIKRYALWGKIYDNEKFARKAKTMQGRLDRMEKIDRPVLERRTMGLTLNGWRGSKKVLELTHLSKAFADHRVLIDLNLLVRHGERVGLIGANGAGKSVLLRTILGEIAPERGEVKIGPSVKIGYYAQEHDTLDFDQTLIDAVRYAGSMSEANAVAFLIRYLFTYRQASQRIGELSGGERSRLQLALIVLSGANFLLLDEPTNNLDIASAEVLESALEDFEGSVLVISHDRYFLDRTVARIVELENGCLASFTGGYSDYLMQKSV